MRTLLLIVLVIALLAPAVVSAQDLAPDPCFVDNVTHYHKKPKAKAHAFKLNPTVQYNVTLRWRDWYYIDQSWIDHSSKLHGWVHVAGAHTFNCFALPVVSSWKKPHKPHK